MRRDLGSDVLFNLVMMMRMRSQRSVLLAESDQDADFYRRFVSDPHCLVRGACGRAGVLETLDRFSQFKVKGCVGIIDADCDYVLRRPRPTSNVCLTDKTDKETTVIDSSAFDLFCAALGATIPAASLRGLLYESGFPLGAIRRVAFREGMALDFKRINFRNFIGAGLVCTITRCCEEVASVNPHLDVSVQTLIDFTRDEVCLSLPRAHVVRGHDLVAILESQSRPLFGREVSLRELDYELAAAYTVDHFKCTQTYTDLRKWEGTVRPTYRLFV
jgi:hypothetical protein